jgi:phenylalanyl-tRNA synthetase alpha chain
MSTCTNRPAIHHSARSHSAKSRSVDDGPLSPEALDAALTLRDLADPAAGPHAVQSVVTAVEGTLHARWGIPVRRDPGGRIVPVADNYDALRYTADAATRDRRYTRYVGDGRMLRSHTSARIPALLRSLAAGQRGGGGAAGEVLLSVPGLTYRRDVIDRHHVGEPHQLDLWRIRTNAPALTDDDLTAMIATVVEAVLPGHSWRIEPSPHPYTLAGREVLIATGEGAVEVGECGLAHPGVLAAAGLPPSASGLAMGLGLDRLVMLAKGVDDIRLLRSADLRIADQMVDLAPYRPVSVHPVARRDLSVAVDAGLDEELLGDRVRASLGADVAALEEVRILSRTPYSDLPGAVRQRLGMRPGQDNILLRVLLRALDRTLTSAEANALRDRIYAAVHAQ